jgi:3-oxoacyl-[acyl-carrier protein] reductase
MSQQKYILITGSNGGVGRMIANHLLAQNYREILFHYRSVNDDIAKICKKFDLDPSIHCLQADLCDAESVNNMKSIVQAKFGVVDRLINVAGGSTNGMSWKLSTDEFMSVIKDNLLSTFLCTKAFVPEMRENKFGRVINFSSIVGATGVVGAAHYCAAKAGVVGYTKALSLELASRGVTANAIALGYFNAGLIEDIPQDIKTQILTKIPAGRFGEEKDIGYAIEFLLSEQSQYYTGQVMHLNGGQF